MGFSAKISTKNLVPIFENSQGQCPRKDFRIFPDLSGFIRILISCPNFFLKKDKFFIFIFCKKFIFFSFILGFSAKFRFKQSCPNFRKVPRSMSEKPHFPTTYCVSWFYASKLKHYTHCLVLGHFVSFCLIFVSSRHATLSKLAIALTRDISGISTTVQALRWPILMKISSNIHFCVAFVDSMFTKKFGSPSSGNF